ncbi:hypothetical protein HY642_06160, partial [Candidatus Woesearchaeota archaeon]|nr:hypothetical protein [Candidatus Woesearchaeota archaeon]
MNLASDELLREMYPSRPLRQEDPSIAYALPRVQRSKVMFSRARIFQVSQNDAYVSRPLQYNGQRYSGILYFGLLQDRDPRGCSKNIMYRYAALCHRRGINIAVPLAFMGTRRATVIAAAVQTPIPFSALKSTSARNSIIRHAFNGDRAAFEKFLKNSSATVAATLRALKKAGLRYDAGQD